MVVTPRVLYRRNGYGPTLEVIRLEMGGRVAHVRDASGAGIVACVPVSELVVVTG